MPPRDDLLGAAILVALIICLVFLPELFAYSGVKP